MNRLNIFYCLLGISIATFVGTAQARLGGEGIRGGDDAKEGAFPYQVSLETLDESFCGGTIIGEKYVVTAAHCVIDENGDFVEDPITVVAGINDLASTSNSRVAVEVERIFVLKEYDPTDVDQALQTADIAVLKLQKELGIGSNPNLGKADLPKKDEDFDGIEAVISGFGYNDVDLVDDSDYGRIEINGYTSGKMRYAKAEIVDTEKCDGLYDELTVTPKHICAALKQRDPNQPEGVCSGDSGGPLVYEKKLIGVVSTSPLGCREDELPAIYTRVSSFLNFIKNAVNGKVTKKMRTFKP